MKGLLIKDLLELRLKMKRTILFIFFYTAFTMLFLKSASYFIVIAVLYAITFPLTSIALDERSKWNVYALTMPLSRRDYVLGKYVLSLLCTLTAFLLCAAAVFVLGRSELGELAPFGVIMLCCALIYSAFMLPFALALGTERARLIMLGMLLIPSALIAFMSQSGGVSMPDFLAPSQLRVLLFAAPIVSLTVFALSAPVACALYSRREL